MGQIMSLLCYNYETEGVVFINLNNVHINFAYLAKSIISVIELTKITNGNQVFKKPPIETYLP